MSEFVLIVKEDVPLGDLFEGAGREGWVGFRRAPRRGHLAPFWGFRTGAEDHHMFIIDEPTFGVRYVWWKDPRPMPAWLEAAIIRRSPDELASRAREASTPAEKIATLCEAVGPLAPMLPDPVKSVLAERLRDPEEAVRWMARASVVVLSDQSLEAVLAELLAKEGIPADIEGWAREVHEIAAAAVRGDYTGDLESANEDYLRDVLRRSFEAKHWQRVEIAAAKLLWKEYPYYELEAAAAWAAAMAATGRVFRAYFAALMVSEIERKEGREGVAATLRAEIEPTLATREDLPTREDIHPVLWLVRERLNEKYTEACDRCLDALDAHVKNLEAERVLLRAISMRSSEEGRPLAKRLRDLLPGAITPLALLAYMHGWDDCDDEALADAEALAAAMNERKLAAKGKAAPPSPEMESFDAWAAGILAYQARKPKDLIRDHVRILQKRGDLEGALRATERMLEAEDSALAWLDKGMILTGLSRHEDAIAAYDEAIARVGKDGKVLLGGSYDVAWFNRACERAFTGDREGALRDLAEAVRQDDKWIESAKTDAYFDSIRSDPRFEAILSAKSEEDLGRTTEPELQDVDPGDEPPEVVATRLRWERIVHAIGALREAGFDDGAILEILKEGIRGSAPSPKVARVEGAASAISAFVEEVTTSQKGNFVVVLMALEMAESGARSLDEALDDIKGLCIASSGVAAAERVDDDEEEEEDDDADEVDEANAGPGDGAPPWIRDPFGNPYVDAELNRRLYGDEDEDEDEDEDCDDDEDYDDDNDDDD